MEGFDLSNVIVGYEQKAHDACAPGDCGPTYPCAPDDCSPDE